MFDSHEWTKSWSQPLRLERQAGPSPFAFFISSVLISKPKAKSNQTHPETHTAQCTLSVEAQSEEAEGLPYALFSGLLCPHEYRHYSKYSKYSWMARPLMLNLHDSRVESWFESWSDCIRHVLLKLRVQQNQAIVVNVSWFDFVCASRTGGFSDPRFPPESILVKPEPTYTCSFKHGGVFTRLLQPLLPLRGRRLPPVWGFTLLPTPPVVLSPTPAVRGGCAGRFQGARCCASPRKPCASGPLQTPAVDRCPSASSGSPATPPVWRKPA